MDAWNGRAQPLSGSFFPWINSSIIWSGLPFHSIPSAGLILVGAWTERDSQSKHGSTGRPPVAPGTILVTWEKGKDRLLAASVLWEIPLWTRKCAFPGGSCHLSGDATNRKCAFQLIIILSDDQLTLFCNINDKEKVWRGNRSCLQLVLCDPSGRSSFNNV